MADSVELLAVKLAIEFLKRNGWDPKDVSHAIGEHGGYDLYAQKDSKILKIEVKGSASHYKGIPDLHETQVDKSKNLVADYLFVGYFPPGEPERLAIIPSSEIPPSALTPKVSYRIANSHKSRERIRGFLVDTGKPWP